ncbi:MAG: electron transfer flavoprotein subunit alpha/FixB family protein, partial [Gammaproteobacteria bacterium]|nr:electron transfer flavoprotein subunit alpha/FixB family protein [Gammaproteobacteria bacterium]
MSILIIAEHDNRILSASILPVVTAAKQLGDDISVLVAGKGCNNVAEQVSSLNNISRVLVAEAEYYQHQLAEELALLIVDQ